MCLLTSHESRIEFNIFEEVKELEEKVKKKKEAKEPDEYC